MTVNNNLYKISYLIKIANNRDMFRNIIIKLTLSTIQDKHFFVTSAEFL
jgi:hypothetical protein